MRRYIRLSAILLTAAVLAVSLVAGNALAHGGGPNNDPNDGDRLEEMIQWMGADNWSQMIQRMTQFHGAEWTAQMLQNMNENGACHGSGDGSMMGQGLGRMMGGLMGGR